MDLDPLPLLLRDDVAHDAAANRPSRLEYRITVLEEALQGGGWGGDAEEAACICAAEPIDPNATDALPMEGPVDERNRILDIGAGQLEGPTVNQLETALVHGRLWGRRLLLGGPSGPPVPDHRPVP